MTTKYRLVPDPEDIDAPYWCVEIQEGEFAGVICQFLDAKIPRTPNEEGNLPVQFEYDIRHIPEELLKKEFGEEKRQEFANILGGILMNEIQSNLESESGVVENGGSTGDDNSKGFVVQRRIHTQGPAFLRR